MAEADYIALRDALVSKPQIIVVMTLDSCSLTYSVGACTASGDPGDECYNTLGTCQDVDNYDKTTKDYKFCMHGRDLPLPGENILPYLLDDSQVLPTEIDPLGSAKIVKNAKVTLKFADEPDNDVGIDPYVDNRSYTPEDQGTFWRKLLARNLYTLGRSVVIKHGYQGLAEADYEHLKQKYIIEGIKGPDRRGVVSVVLKDPLKRADRVKVPVETFGEVDDNPLLAGANVINLDDSSAYPASGYVRIDDEIKKFTGNAANQLTGVTGAHFGTSDVNHTQDTRVQLCYVQESINVWDIINDILQNEVGFDAADIDEAGAEEEVDRALQAFTFTGIVSKPTKASDLLTELTEQSMSYLFWDEEVQKIRFKAFFLPSPDDSIADLNETEHLAELAVDNNEKSRISRVVVHYEKDAIGDLKKQESYSRSYIVSDEDAADPEQYGEHETKTIFSRWITTATIARRIGTVFRNRFRDPPKKVAFIVSPKDSDMQIADIIELTTDRIVNPDGSARASRRYQILKKKHVSPATYRFDVLDSGWSSLRYGNIAPAGTPDFGAATPEQKEDYVFISAGGPPPVMSDGTGSYVIF